MKQITKRLLPGQDLKAEIQDLVKMENIEAGVLLSVVGSLTKLKLRLADGETVKEWDGQFEIVGGTGTVSVNGCHIHISVSDVTGKTLGGHLKDDCIVGTTVELVVGVFDDIEYRREMDEATGYKELKI